MKLLLVPFLLTAAAQGGDDAAKRFQAMEDKIARAAALQVTVEARIESPQGEGTIKGKLTARGNKARVEMGVDFMGKALRITMVCDGTKMVSSEDGRSAESNSLLSTNTATLSLRRRPPRPSRYTAGSILCVMPERNTEAEAGCKIGCAVWLIAWKPKP